VPGGRCDVCEGDGTVTVEMQFLADVELPCEECNGTRYKASVLEVKYRGKSIYEVLNLTIKEALRFFTGQTRILEKLAVLDEVGLGYVRLGQSATTLSGEKRSGSNWRRIFPWGAAQPDEPPTGRPRRQAAACSISWMNRPPACTSTM
jgi:hypothetical protein